jgi:RNA polymerase sigma-70 factor (ECF subfamily)
LEAADARKHLAALIARVAQRDRAAFEQIYKETSRRLYGVALRIVREPSAAQDVIQDAFIRLWRYAHTFNENLSAPETWLHQIVRNRALDMVTSHANKMATLSLDQFSGDDDDESGPIEIAVNDVETEEHVTVRGCLSALDGKYRQVLTLAFNHGMSHAEISEHIGVPLGTVKTWARRGLIELKAAYEAAQHKPSVRNSSSVAASAA